MAASTGDDLWALCHLSWAEFNSRSCRHQQQPIMVRQDGLAPEHAAVRRVCGESRELGHREGLLQAHPVVHLSSTRPQKLRSVALGWKCHTEMQNASLVLSVQHHQVLSSAQTFGADKVRVRQAEKLERFCCGPASFRACSLHLLLLWVHRQHLVAPGAS